MFDTRGQVAMLQQAAMDHILIVLAIRRWRVNRYWIHPWLSADRRLQFGHYNQLIRDWALKEDSSSFFKFNHMGMEPLMLDEILNRVGSRIQRSDTNFRRPEVGQNAKSVTEA